MIEIDDLIEPRGSRSYLLVSRPSATYLIPISQSYREGRMTLSNSREYSKRFCKETRAGARKPANTISLPAAIKHTAHGMKIPRGRLRGH